MQTHHKACTCINNLIVSITNNIHIYIYTIKTYKERDKESKKYILKFVEV